MKERKGWGGQIKILSGGGLDKGLRLKNLWRDAGERAVAIMCKNTWKKGTRAQRYGSEVGASRSEKSVGTDWGKLKSPPGTGDSMQKLTNYLEKSGSWKKNHKEGPTYKK